MGSPVTLMMRPSVPGPTGMVMGAPVSVALAPRTRPSVPIHETVSLGLGAGDFCGRIGLGVVGIESG